MQLPKDGQEYAHITFDQLPDDVAVEVSTDNRITWFPTSDGATSRERTVLLRGPISSRTDGHLVVQDSDLWVRVTDLPETVVRRAGRVYLG